LLAIFQRDAHVAGLQAGDQRRVARRDAQFAQFAGGDDERDVALEDFVFGTDDVAADGAHVGFLSVAVAMPPPVPSCAGRASPLRKTLIGWARSLAPRCGGC